ncbi:ADP-ribosylglycohydrolase family protein [Caballeronia sp. AZ7_KS35]|uniref:ADP-ribosylglycohydrolase family protein n=1 Tax=Caballeronia sp. AZ7_KS35 TaxID=2921762 RepID=UPI002027A641|nr:ADP-ribosylglycohydrolase family protein [Caballeronia sp. AZ7_KS35]
MGNDNGFLSLAGCDDERVGGIVGLLVGDALGVSFEFHNAASIPARELIEMTPPPGFQTAHSGVSPGTWSDDGSQAICLLASLLQCGRFSLSDFAQRLLQWADEGYMAVDGDVFDIGIQTSRALQRLREGKSPRESGGSGERDNGNGSLMRVLPLALWHPGSDRAVVGAAHVQSLPTHAHPRSQVACAIYSLVARAYLWKLDDPWTWADARLQAVYEQWADEASARTFLAELDVLRQFLKTETPRGTGYVLDTLLTAKTALEEGTFQGVARAAIQFGNDTDSTAAVACGLAGLSFGIDGIPTRWLDQLRGFDLIESLLDMLAKRPTPEPFEDDEWGGGGVDGMPSVLIDWSEARERRRRAR